MCPLWERAEDTIKNINKSFDKLSALIKCMEEEKTGNREFVKAKESTEQMVQELSKSYPEVKDFVQEFLPAYAKTLDELS